MPVLLRHEIARTVWPHPGSYSDMVVMEDLSIGYIYL